MRAGFVNFKAPEVHFQKLTPRNKTLACEAVARMPLAIFTVCSNKKNMRGYSNPLAELRSLDRNWFYCWLTRTLLERVTHFAYGHAVLNGNNPKIKIVFSTRGGMSYSQLTAYFELLKLQTRVSGLFLDNGHVYFDTIDRKLVEIQPHETLPGLKLADIAASAFFSACDKHSTGACEPRYATALKPRMAATAYKGLYDQEAFTTFAGYGLKLLPSFKGANLDRDQQAIFRDYGYPRQWWDAPSSNSSPYRLATVANRDFERPE